MAKEQFIAAVVVNQILDNVIKYNADFAKEFALKAIVGPVVDKEKNEQSARFYNAKHEVAVRILEQLKSTIIWLDVPDK